MFCTNRRKALCPEFAHENMVRKRCPVKGRSMFPDDSAFRASWTVQTPSGVPLVLAYFAERRYTNVFGTDLLFGESVWLVAALS